MEEGRRKKGIIKLILVIMFTGNLLSLNAMKIIVEVEFQRLAPLIYGVKYFWEADRLVVEFALTTYIQWWKFLAARLGIQWIEQR